MRSGDPGKNRGSRVTVDALWIITLILIESIYPFLDHGDVFMELTHVGY